MTTRTRRWLTIAICLAIPLGVVWIGSTAIIPESSTVDPSYPAKCEALFTQVGANDAAKALQAAKTLAGATDATREEQLCGQDVATKLGVVGAAPAPPADFSSDPCKLGEALSARGVATAAQAVFQLARENNDPKFVGCARTDLDKFTTPPPPDLPNCAAVGRALASAPAQGGMDALVAALRNPGTTPADAICLEQVRQTLDTLTPPPALPIAIAPPALEQKCADAVGFARKGDVEQARARYEEQRDDASLSFDQRTCAVGGLSRLSARSTFADWTFDRVNHATQRLTGWLPSGPIVLAAGTASTVTAVIWFLTAGLVLIAFRQWIRWRRERLPGPVKISAITVDDDKDIPLAELIRDRLDNAGIAPFSSKPFIGQVSVDVVDVLTVADVTGRFGQIATAIKDALSLEAGFLLTASLDHDTTADKPFGLVVQLDDVATGNTYCIETWRGASARDAAICAAYGVYLELSKRDEVVRRTPAYLRWTSIDGLRAYHDGLDAYRDGDNALALEKYGQAETAEVGNLAVQLGLTRAYYARADELIESDTEGAPQNFIKAVLAALRAATLNGYSVEAHSQLGLAAYRVDEWASAWNDADVAGDRAEICLLLEKPDLGGPPSDGPSTLKDLFETEARLEAALVIAEAVEAEAVVTHNVAEHIAAKLIEAELIAAELIVEHAIGDKLRAEAARRRVEVADYFKKLADESWRLALHRTWWPRVVYVWAWLYRRRTVEGMVWPFSRKRAGLHDLILANVVGTKYDLLGPGARPDPGNTPAKKDGAATSTPPDAAPRGAWRTRIRLRLGLWCVRFGWFRGLRRARDQEDRVQYNLAAAYARRAVYLGSAADSGNFKSAIRHLNRSYLGPAQRVVYSELDDIEGDPDFKQLCTQDVYKKWRAQFLTKKADVWSDRFTALAGKCDAAALWWDDHLVQRTAPGKWWSNERVLWAQKVLTWFGDDVERWLALKKWIAQPSADDAQAAFERLVPAPPLNNNRAIEPAGTPKLSATEYEPIWKARATAVDASLKEAQAALAKVLEAVEQRSPDLLADVADGSYLSDLANPRKQRWIDMRKWALAPSS